MDGGLDDVIGAAHVSVCILDRLEKVFYSRASICFELTLV